MKVRLLTDLGMFHGHPDTKRGDIVDVDDEVRARGYIAAGYVEAVTPPVEYATLPEPEMAVVEVVGEDRPRPKPLDEVPRPPRPQPRRR